MYRDRDRDHGGDRRKGWGGNGNGNGRGGGSGSGRGRGGGTQWGGAFIGTGSGNNGGGRGKREFKKQGELEGCSNGIRETGVVERLLPSYGFIECCDREYRLFFHFAQFHGDAEHLKRGDLVEFEVSCDLKTGKAVGTRVCKIDAINDKVALSEDRVTGIVTAELHIERNGELQGRISYENHGECFFLPYTMEDVEGRVHLSVGNTVTFQIGGDKRSGAWKARGVRLENPEMPVRYRGVVSSLKDNLGIIDRADVVKEVYFRSSETDAISIGGSVEFSIETLNRKDVACSITKMADGAVVIYDIGTEILQGQVIQPIDWSRCYRPPFGPTPRLKQTTGILRYRGPEREELEVMFGENDPVGHFTMRYGDWVQFQLAVDRRNMQQRATNISLLDQSFVVAYDERREEGVIIGIKEDYCGYIICAQRDECVSFRFSELLEHNRQPKIADNVEFTIVNDETSPVRQSAIRIKYLTQGSVQFEIPWVQGLEGVVTREPSTPWVNEDALSGILPALTNRRLPADLTERLVKSLSSSEARPYVRAQFAGMDGDNYRGEPGIIEYERLFDKNGPWERQHDSISFDWKDCKNLRTIRVGTKVLFDIHQVRRSRQFIAANIRADPSAVDPQSSVSHMPQYSGNDATTGKPAEPTSSVSSSSDVSASETIRPPSANFPGMETIGTNDNDAIEQEKRPSLPKVISSYETEEIGDGSGSGRCSRRSNRALSDYYDDISDTQSESSGPEPNLVLLGYVAALKEGFGFIETMNQDGEIFFHSSSVVVGDFDFNSLEIGQEIDYVISSKLSSAGKRSAEMVMPMPKGLIQRPEVRPNVLQGTVMRPLRGGNRDQPEYAGLIEEEGGQTYHFGIMSMLNTRELLQIGDTVEFQLDVEGRPRNVQVVRKKFHATVEAVKGQYGFLSYELEDGKKLFFHTKEVKDNQHLNPGDEVEFIIYENPKSGKLSACSVIKVDGNQRPERLLNRLSKITVDEGAPRVIAIRQPYGLDGTKGFSKPRLPRKHGVLLEDTDTPLEELEAAKARSFPGFLALPLPSSFSPSCEDFFH